MCKYCDGPPYEKAKYQFPLVEDWEDPAYAHHPRKVKRQKSSLPKGCVENNHGAHAYVIVKVDGWEYRYQRTAERGFMAVQVPATWYEQRCVGCGKMKRSYKSYWHGGDPVGRFFNAEDIYQTEIRPREVSYYG